MEILGSVAGALIGADAAGDAADTQAAASDRASQTQERMFQQIRSDNAPALSARNASINQLLMYLGIDPAQVSQPGPAVGEAPSVLNGLGIFKRIGLNQNNVNQVMTGAKPIANYSTTDPRYGSLVNAFSGGDLANDPGYKFRLAQGMKALENSAAARGGLYSGAAMRGITDYSQGLASTEFGNAFNRDAANKDRIFNQLSGLAGLGSSITSQTQNAGMGTANAIASNMIGAGNAQAAAGMARGNVFADAVNGIGARLGGFGGFGGLQGAFSNTPLGGAGFGTGLAYGNQDLGQFF